VKLEYNDSTGRWHVVLEPGDCNPLYHVGTTGDWVYTDTDMMDLIDHSVDTMRQFPDAEAILQGLTK